MKRLGVVLLAMVAGVSLTGCVVVISDEEAGGVHWASEYEEVREQHNRERTEAAQALLDEVRARFDNDEFVRDEAILIAAKDGTVTLSGEASSVEVVDRAVGIATDTAGVESVVSRVVVYVDN